jgi:hypothetical protein
MTTVYSAPEVHGGNGFYKPCGMVRLAMRSDASLGLSASAWRPACRAAVRVGGRLARKRCWHDRVPLEDRGLRHQDHLRLIRHLQSKYRAAVRITFGLAVKSRLSRTLVIPAKTILCRRSSPIAWRGIDRRGCRKTSRGKQLIKTREFGAPAVRVNAS